MRIENWYITSRQNNPYGAPENGIMVLAGNVFGHPKFDNGSFITTSMIIGKTEVDEVVTKSGSLYELGRVNNDYERTYPNARERLLAVLGYMADTSFEVY